MTNLPQQTIDRINADALTYSEQQHGHDEPSKDYIEGALREARRAQGLVDTLTLLNTWIDECMGHGKLLDADKAMQVIDTALAKYKEVGNG